MAGETFRPPRSGLPRIPSGTTRRDPSGRTLEHGWHSRGYLPHLKEREGTYFITFRLADTLPQRVADSYRAERENIIGQATDQQRELSPDERRRLAELYAERIDAYLDAGHGQCWLRNPSIAAMVAQALCCFDGERYDLYAWAVMPNHVHAVVEPLNGHTLSDLLHTWKSFTAHEVRRLMPALGMVLPKTAAFWQRESYDHLVRNREDFDRVCQYTVNNPVQAGLCLRPEEWPYVGMSSNP